MTTRELWLRAWDFDPSVIAGCIGLLVWHSWRVRARKLERLWFWLGVVVLFLALESPLDTLGDTYLFCAHMAQHLLLILIVSPLLLLGISEEEARRWLSHPRIARAERILGRPAIAWTAAIVTMTGWHLPLLYNFALAHEGVHVFQHMTFLVTATMFWWPIVSPLPERRLAPGPAVLYLFTAAAESSVLGITLTFISVGSYPAYVHPADPIGALSLIRDQWGISAQLDQRLGGLLMWVPGCCCYFISILLVLAFWFAKPDSDFADNLSLGGGPNVEGAA